MKTAKERSVKYCNKCQREVTVVKHGKPGKHRYKCDICGSSFVERKYPIEIRSLAVRFYGLGYSYRKIAKIFGIEKSHNNVRNWIVSKVDYKVPDKSTITILKDYKEVLEQIEKLVQLEQKKLQNEINKLDDDLTKPNLYSNAYMCMTKQKNELCVKQRKLGKIQHPYSIAELKGLLNDEANEKINEQEKIKIRIEAECVFARDTYDILEIINILEKITT